MARVQRVFSWLVWGEEEGAAGLDQAPLLERVEVVGMNEPEQE